MTTQQLYANLIEILALGMVNTDEEQDIFAKGFTILVVDLCESYGLTSDDTDEIAQVESTLLQKLHKNAQARRQYLSTQAA
jgi:hypothetical protein